MHRESGMHLDRTYNMHTSITSRTSAECCGKLKEQECGYIQNPLFSQYVTSANVHMVLATCGIPYPTC
ncbi:unnamed protein product [Brassica oleracea var. botrytis]